MFTNNKTIAWLEGKDLEEQAKLIKQASVDARKMQATFKNRYSTIVEKQRERVRQKIRDKERLHAQKIKQLEQYTNDIIYHGLWQTETQIVNMLESYKSLTEKKKALKVQFQFRKHVLKQEPLPPLASDVFNLSKKGKQLTVDQLLCNLKQLVNQAAVRTEGGADSHLGHILVRKRVKHKFTTDTGDENWYLGKVVSQVPVRLKVCKQNFTICIYLSQLV